MQGMLVAVASAVDGRAVNRFDRLAPIVVQAEPIAPAGLDSTWGCHSLATHNAACAYFEGAIQVLCPELQCQPIDVAGFSPITGNDQAQVDPTDTVAADCALVVRSS